MSLRLSTAFLAALAGAQGYYDILKDCTLKVYSGSQPASADDAPSGVELFTITNASGSYTPETRAAMTVDLTGLTTGETITSLKIGGIEILGSTVTYGGGSAAATASTMADTINAFRSNPDFNAVYTSGSSFVVYAPKNTGTSLNGLSITVAGTGASAGHVTINSEAANASPDTLSATFGGAGTGSTAGVAAVNGLDFTFPANTKVLSKNGTWTGVAGASGTAGWGRFICRNKKTGAADSSGTDSTVSDMRMDVAVGTSSAVAECVVASTTVASGATQTINTCTITIGG